jgi:hypothetical protein
MSPAFDYCYFAAEFSGPVSPVRPSDVTSLDQLMIDIIQLKIGHVGYSL